ncbi:MAG: N-acetylglucosamine-6-phosphate deacetylase [Clostridia bacterium]|nr:N-acetylglucosamine-6-phosphate deacetylase [Clostridia bacterium]
MIKIKSDKIIVGKELFDGYVYIENGLIKWVTNEDIPCETTYDYTGKYVSPGFIDIHTHGGGGYPFISGSVESVINACDFHVKHGTTSIVPTISTDDFSVMVSAVKDISEAKKRGRGKANIIGAHLEGPYLSKNQSGAQSGSFIKAPVKAEYEKLVYDFGSDIVRWTYAPENDKDGEFCSFITKHGIVASAGHSDACYDDMKKAVANDCNLITHLYSCTSTVKREKGFRILGVIESAYLLDELFVEIIADGKHLPHELINMIIKIKGEDKVCLITDSLEIAGSNVTEGVMSGVEYVVEEGVCKLKDGTGFAGSIATCDGLIKTLVFGCGYSIPYSVSMLTKTPAKVMGLNKGELKQGCDADVVVFDDNIAVSDVFVLGKKVI